jgi:hypothetical protein
MAAITPALRRCECRAQRRCPTPSMRPDTQGRRKRRRLYPRCRTRARRHAGLLPFRSFDGVAASEKAAASSGHCWPRKLRVFGKGLRIRNRTIGRNYIGFGHCSSLFAVSALAFGIVGMLATTTQCAVELDCYPAAADKANRIFRVDNLDRASFASLHRSRVRQERSA